MSDDPYRPANIPPDPPPLDETPHFPRAAVLLVTGIPLAISVLLAMLTLSRVWVPGGYGDLAIFGLNTFIIAPLCGIIAGVTAGLHYKRTRTEWVGMMILCIIGCSLAAIAVSCAGCVVMWG